MQHDVVQLDMVQGRYSIFTIDPNGRWTFRFTKNNLVLFSWGMIAAKCIGQGNVDYKVSAAYLEYENVVSPGDAVTVPTMTRADDLSYYNGLGSGKDFLRVALTGTPAIDIATGSEDYFEPGVTGNQCTFIAQSTGSTGVLGRAFSDTVNSKIYGIALVATPLFADRSQDILLCRGYFEVADQILKPSSQQVGVRWKVAFR